MTPRLFEGDRWKFFAILPRADSALAVAWWTVLALRGVLPALFAIAIGTLVGAVQRGEDLSYPLALVGIAFLPLQVLSPLHHVIGANLGSRTASWLYDRLTSACIRPQGMGHLEDPELTTDLTMARDFDLAITGSANEHLHGLHRLRSGGDGGWPGFRGRTLRLRLVGPASARRRLARNPLALA